MLEVKPKPVSKRPLPRAGLSIAEAARRTGVSVHTLRYYERAGLVITTVHRNHSGRRRYQAEDLKWISICTKLRATGMPIRTISATPSWYPRGQATRRNGSPCWRPTAPR